MNSQIRKLGTALMVMFCALFIQLTNLQVIKADQLKNDPRNTRVAEREFNSARGVIKTADDVVLAHSVEQAGAFERRRLYPEGRLFGHITGFFSFTYGAQNGVEQTYKDELAGDVVRLEDPGRLFRTEEYTENVTLTITKSLQQTAADALAGKRGSVVALDPRTGAILAMYSNPTYDPNPLSQYDQKAVQDYYNTLVKRDFNPLRSRSYGDRFAPGSTFKVVTAGAALERASDLVDKSYPRIRRLDLPQTNLDLPNFGGASCGGRLPDLLRVSCNTGFAQLGIDIGGGRMTETAEAFGFNDRPPLDLRPVATSQFPDSAAFERNTPALAYSAIGQQDVAASPLQMALVAAGVGNGGVIMKPHVMAEIRNGDGDVVRKYAPKKWKTPLSPSSAEALKNMMVDVVNRGTARRAAVAGNQVAAKTGTAQTEGNNAHAWLIAFAPADQPRVAIAVIVESQPGLGSEVTGGSTAAPIAKRVMEQALKIVP